MVFIPGFFGDVHNSLKQIVLLFFITQMQASNASDRERRLSKGG